MLKLMSHSHAPQWYEVLRVSCLLGAGAEEGLLEL